MCAAVFIRRSFWRLMRYMPQICLGHPLLCSAALALDVRDMRNAGSIDEATGVYSNVSIVSTNLHYLRCSSRLTFSFSITGS